MNLAPDQFESLKRVLAEPAALISGVLGLPLDHVEGILTKLEIVTRRLAPTLGAERIMVSHAAGQNGVDEIDGPLITRLIKASTPLLTIGDDGRMISAGQGAVTLPAAAAGSEVGPKLTALCSAGQLCLFAAGKIIAEIGTPSRPTSGKADWKHSWREMRSCFDAHFEHCVQNEKQLRYWQDKANRILLAGPDGTEALFHHSLFWWCNNFIFDALKVYAEANTMGQDKTDIIVVTEVGTIVIEVKWLGRSASTQYHQIRIHEGIIQVADYLERDLNLAQGYLVMYDGRSEDKHRDESTYPPAARHQRCEEPIIYFLRTEAPSVRATRLAAQARRDNISASNSPGPSSQPTNA